MLPVVETVDLCPVVHVVHPFLLPSPMTGGSVENPTRCGRCQGFDRREVSIVQAASTLPDFTTAGPAALAQLRAQGIDPSQSPEAKRKLGAANSGTCER